MEGDVRQLPNLQCAPCLSCHPQYSWLRPYPLPLITKESSLSFAFWCEIQGLGNFYLVVKSKPTSIY